MVPIGLRRQVLAALGGATAPLALGERRTSCRVLGGYAPPYELCRLGPPRDCLHVLLRGCSVEPLHPHLCLRLGFGGPGRSSGQGGSPGSGFRVQGLGFRVQGSGFRVQGSRFSVQGSGLASGF
ncbi:hypothetical protein T484DRAFT_1608009 [Baffinella frigidus]|nr:hypothetical protein T484DRAFT_1608009 [Cryptophyta sp. CCMP2293]